MDPKDTKTFVRRHCSTQTNTHTRAHQRIQTMTDNKLRCVLVYRLQRTKTTTADSASSSTGGVDGIALTNLSPGPVTLLAKYDHASEYEGSAAAAAAGGGLYGDREKNYADAVAMVISSDPPRGITEENTMGGFKIVQSDMHQVIYGADSRGLCEFGRACLF